MEPRDEQRVKNLAHLVEPMVGDLWVNNRLPRAVVLKVLDNGNLVIALRTEEEAGTTLGRYFVLNDAREITLTDFKTMMLGKGTVHPAAHVYTALRWQLKEAPYLKIEEGDTAVRPWRIPDWQHSFQDNSLNWQRFVSELVQEQWHELSDHVKQEQYKAAWIALTSFRTWLEEQ